MVRMIDTGSCLIPRIVRLVYFQIGLLMRRPRTPKNSQVAFKTTLLMMQVNLATTYLCQTTLSLTLRIWISRDSLLRMKWDLVLKARIQIKNWCSTSTNKRVFLVRTIIWLKLKLNHRKRNEAANQRTYNISNKRATKRLNNPKKSMRSVEMEHYKKSNSQQNWVRG